MGVELSQPRAGGTIHISAAEKDGEIRDALVRLLSGLHVTHLGNLDGGDDISTRRRELIEAASMIVLLVSANLTSDDDLVEDAKLALERHDAEETWCVPVLARACLWKGRPYAHLMHPPHDGRPLQDGATLREDALAEVAGWIHEHATSRGAVNPFPGLRSFTPKDADYFFGRKKEIAEALALLAGPSRRPRWLLIEGPSGAGKSSFAQAGIVPAVLGGKLEGAPKRWVTVMMRPGHDPITSLADALLRSAPPRSRLANRPLADVRKDLLADGPPTGLASLLLEALPDEEHGVLLVVDQLEDIFSLAHANTPAVAQFDAQLAAALAADDVPLLLVTTLRNDFLASMEELPELNERLARNEVAVSTLRWMGEVGLREVIEKPADRAGLTYDALLVDRIVHDAYAARDAHAATDAHEGHDTRVAPGALPLVAQLLETLYAGRRGRRLTTEAYEAAGGVGGALARGADAIVEALGEELQERARKLLLRLVTINSHGEATLQTSEREAALGAAGGGVEAHQVLRGLSSGVGPGPVGRRALPGRLVAVSGEVGRQSVGLVHVALLQRWGTLRAWIKAALPVLKLRDAVEQAARIWAAHGKDEGNLPQGSALRRFMTVERAELQDVAREFLFAANSVELRREARRRFRRIVWATAVLAGLAYVVSRSAMLAKELERTKREQIRATNMNLATLFAGNLASQLRALSDAVESTAQEKDVALALQMGDFRRLQARCEEKYLFYKDPSRRLKFSKTSPFNMWFILDGKGIVRAQYGRVGPPGSLGSEGSIGRDYPWRDYFIGAGEMAKRGLHTAYVSRAFTSENDGLRKFAISAPIYGDDGTSVGVIVAGIAAEAKLGEMGQENDVSKAVLVAPSDRERILRSGEPPYLLLRHTGLAYGSALEIDNRDVREISEASLANVERYERLLWPADQDMVRSRDDYQDPSAERDEAFRGTWLAGFAPVGGTGFVVIVQTPESEATRDAAVFLALARFVGFAGMLGAAAGLVLGTIRLAPAALGWWKKKAQERRIAAKQKVANDSAPADGAA